MSILMKIAVQDQGMVWNLNISEEVAQRIEVYSKTKTEQIIPPALSRKFFFPTVRNHALKVENIAVKIFAVLAALIFDVVTLPFRTFFPDKMTTVKKLTHPFYIFLRTNYRDIEISPTSSLEVELLNKKNELVKTAQVSSFALDEKIRKFRFQF
jgi:hypothetical protein